jgi:hypothetical protein
LSFKKLLIQSNRWLLTTVVALVDDNGLTKHHLTQHTNAANDAYASKAVMQTAKDSESSSIPTVSIEQSFIQSGNNAEFVNRGNNPATLINKSVRDKQFVLGAAFSSLLDTFGYAENAACECLMCWCAHDSLLYWVMVYSIQALCEGADSARVGEVV